MKTSNQGDIQRAIALRKIMNDYIRNKTPQERDRMMQVHLAQARGMKLNTKLLCQTMNSMLHGNKSQIGD